MESTDYAFKPYNWLNEAAIFNKNKERIPFEWLEANADIIVLLFSAGITDKDGIIEKFYDIYENVKFVNVPIEVIYIPLDEDEEEMSKAYEKQANWFTLNFACPLIPVLKYMYGITCIPHLLVIRVDGTIISSHAILDLEEYGKNAVITWLSKSSSTKIHRRFSKELSMYGKNWHHINADPNKISKAHYSRKFSNYLPGSSLKFPAASNLSSSI
ncbi:uncharacterized protein LOC120637199 [Pararge aegeria]|uniref:uncharacterized protein LOC120637199 n=1 Tax=Pararge aegeria TaxID=116150 RepID=UPI0019CFE743|nr:uncharacterized protein LOC120637199 [Pararge aegeria]